MANQGTSLTSNHMPMEDPEDAAGMEPISVEVGGRVGGLVSVFVVVSGVLVARREGR